MPNALGFLRYAILESRQELSGCGPGGPSFHAIDVGWGNLATLADILSASLGLCVCVSLSACVSALHNWPPRRRSRTAHTRGGRGRSAAPSGLTLSQARKSARQRERGLQKHQKSGRSLHFIFMVM